MAYKSFDDLDGDGENTDYVPFQFREDKSDEATLKWLNDDFDYLYMASAERLFSYRKIAARYKNRMEPVDHRYHRDYGNSGPAKPKVRTNYFFQYTDDRVAALAQMNLKLRFIPQTDTEQDDINDAEACNTLVDFRFEQLEFNALMSDQDRVTFKYGASFAKIFWDKGAGPIHPKYVEALKKGRTVPALDENGKETGKKLTKFDARLGDVGIKIINPEFIFVERNKVVFQDLDFLDEVEMVNIHELKADYPHLKDKIEKEDYEWLDVDGRGYNNSDQVMVHHFYHRPTKYSDGVYIKYIESCILEVVEEELELQKHMPDDELPFVMDMDMEQDDEFHALTFLVNIEQPNNMHDLVQSGIARNIGVASAPKLAIPEGTVNIKQWNNEFGVVSYRGAKAPEWIQHNYVNRGEFEIQDRLKRDMDKSAKVADFSKDNIPAGVTAASAIRLLVQQGKVTNLNTVNKKKARVRKIAWKTMMMMDKNYQEDDQRMISTLGPDNSYIIKSFKKPKFSKMASVKMEYMSELSEEPAAKLQEIIDLNASLKEQGQAPLFGRKQLVTSFSLGLEKGFKDEAGYAAAAAKTALESLKEGKTIGTGPNQVRPPAKTDDLLETYTIFGRFVESVNYTTKLKPAVKANIDAYINGLEYELAEKAKINPAFKMKLVTFEKYPMFFLAGAAVIAPPPMMPPGGTPAPAGGSKPAPPTESLAKTQEGTLEDQTGGIV